MTLRPVWSLLLAAVGTASAAEPDFAREVRPLLARYCFDCHGQKKSRGEVNFERIAQPLAPEARPLWAHAHAQLRQHEMPPDDRPQLATAERERLLDWLATAVERIDAAAPPQPGRPVLRRLTRFEYRQTIRDLTGVTLDFQFDPTTDLPADGADAGFDTNGTVLTISPLHLTQYLQAAERIVDRAVIAEGLDGPRTWRWEAAQFPGGRSQFTARGQITCEMRIEQEGDYLVRSLLRSPEQNRKRAQLAVIGQDRLEKFTFTRSGQTARVERKIRLPAGRVPVGIAYLYEQQEGSNAEWTGPMQGEIGLDFLEVVGPLGLSRAQVPPSHEQIFHGLHSEGPRDRQEMAAAVIADFGSRAFRRPLTPDEVARYLHLFTQADGPQVSFERALKPVFVALLVSPHFLYRVEVDRPPRAQDGAYALDGFELATRLSYFLWSSLPDAELSAAAASGRLTEEAELVRQTRRMLQDPRAHALAENFATQWLAIRGVENFWPDQKRFGEFGSGLRRAVLQEPVLFFQSVLEDDASLLTLLQADYTFANEELAKLYQLTLPPLPGEGMKKETERRMMRRVPLPPESHRGGVLTTAAVLMASSHPTRTSLVKRGKWVLDNLLGTPPPPPAPNVAALPERAEKGGLLSLRQQVEQHRSEAACAHCHQRMDPLGFALENFDAMGRWRVLDEGRHPIDATATLPDGATVHGPDALKSLLLSRGDEFTHCLAEKLLTYALGRGLEPYDRRALKRIEAATAADQNRLRTLCVEIVRSYPFRNRALLPPAPSKS